MRRSITTYSLRRHRLTTCPSVSHCYLQHDDDRRSTSHSSAHIATFCQLSFTRHFSSNSSIHNLSSSPSSSVSDGILSKAAATQSIDYPTSQRIWALPPAIAVHLSIGSVYVYSMWTPGMAKALGVIAAAPHDWTQPQLLPIFSTAAITLGITTSTLGSWVERVGPRRAGMLGSFLWSSALLTTAAGIQSHSLPLLYLGYGILGGMGWGFMYLTPVTSVMKWFPDKRGLATGIALSAFGVGAALAPSLIHGLVEWFAVGPEFVGECLLTGGTPGSCVELSTLADGSQVVAENSPLGVCGTHVVVATEADVAKSVGSMGTEGPGVYAIGTGDTGVANAMGSLGVLCGCLGALGSRFMMIPHPEWKPNRDALEIKIAETSTDCPTNKSPEENSINVGLPASYVTSNTTQFPLLWLSVFGNATGGLALLSSSKIMLTDIFAGVAPTIVTPAFSTGYVSALGIGMALGRFGWSAISDIIGRRNAYAAFGLGIPVIGMTPYLCHTVVGIAGSVSVTGGEVNMMPYLMTFYSGSVLAITFYGGIFSILPAYIADLFGQKHAGAIHGKALTAWAASAVAGPMGLAYLRSHSQHTAMQDLLHAIEQHDATALERSFGCSMHDDATIEKLIGAKTLTIDKLFELAPPGTVDPTPFLYDSTCYAAAGLMSVAFLSNLAIRPLDLSKALRDMQVKKIT